MTDEASASVPEAGTGSSRLALLLAAAMFVLVVDTSLMNVSISAVVEDLDTTVSRVQAAIALEALVSAAFILISSKVGDLIGRKRAYVLGLLAYAIGALAMTLAQSVTAIIVFWAIIGGLGASLLLPAMQSLIHGNFEGAARKKTYALVGASMAIAAAVGPLLGGFLTTYLSWRVGFALEVVVIAVVLSQIKLVHDVAYTGPRQIDVVGAILSVFGMGGLVLGILVWQEGGEFVGLLMAIGAVALALLAYWLVRRKRAGEADAARPGSLRVPALHDRDLRADAAERDARRRDDRAPDLPADDARVQRDADGIDPRAALAEHVRRGACWPGRKAGKRRPSNIVLLGFVAQHGRDGADHPDRAPHRLGLGARDPVADHGLGARPARVAAEQLHAVPDRGGAGERGSRGELGGGIVRALVRTRDGRRHHARLPRLRVHEPDGREQGDPPGTAAADREHARGRRRGDEQRAARAAARRRAPGRPGRNPPHQQGGTRSVTSGGAARTASSPASSACSTPSA